MASPSDTNSRKKCGRGVTEEHYTKVSVPSWGVEYDSKQEIGINKGQARLDAESLDTSEGPGNDGLCQYRPMHIFANNTTSKIFTKLMTRPFGNSNRGSPRGHCKFFLVVLLVNNIQFLNTKSIKPSDFNVHNVLPECCRMMPLRC